MFRKLFELLGRFCGGREARSIEVFADDEGVGIVRARQATEQLFRWSDVTEIKTFKLDLITFDDIRLAFKVDGGWYEIGEDTPGFTQLTEKMMAIFPAVPADWYADVMLPPFAANERILFECQRATSPNRPTT
jgi:hypothetical protein